MPGPIAPRPMANATASGTRLVVPGVAAAGTRASTSDAIMKKTSLRAVGEPDGGRTSSGIGARAALPYVWYIFYRIYAITARKAASSNHLSGHALSFFLLVVFDLFAGFVLGLRFPVTTCCQLQVGQGEQCEDERLHYGDEQ